MAYKVVTDFSDRVGVRFTRLTVLSFHSRQKLATGSKLFFECLCECANKTVVPWSQLRNGHTRSCGCLYLENLKRNKKNTLSHGFNRKNKRDRVYKIWSGMITRCNNRNQKSYKYYGGRGIRVDPEWRNNFMSFYNDMGHPPEGYSLDRIDVDGDYTRKNCAWASSLQQRMNQRKHKLIAVDCKIETIEYWAKYFYQNLDLVFELVDSGVSYKDALGIDESWVVLDFDVVHDGKMERLKTGVPLLSMPLHRVNRYHHSIEKLELIFRGCKET